ncbi:hypothetical protein [Mesorhizobium sp. BAC0120]
MERIAENIRAGGAESVAVCFLHLSFWPDRVRSGIAQRQGGPRWP